MCKSDRCADVSAFLKEVRAVYSYGEAIGVGSYVLKDFVEVSIGIYYFVVVAIFKTGFIWIWLSFGLAGCGDCCSEA